MTDKVTAIKPTKRPAVLEVEKFYCDCEPGSFYFRATRIGNEVILECSECMRDYGPLHINRSKIEPLKHETAGSD